MNCVNLGFERPSAIQQRAIKPMIKGRDVIAQAQSGTGKTATFSIAMLQSIDNQLRDTQVLCLSPTRELAVQIQKVTYIYIQFNILQTYAANFGAFYSEIKCSVIHDLKIVIA